MWKLEFFQLEFLVTWTRTNVGVRWLTEVQTDQGAVEPRLFEAVRWNLCLINLPLSDLADGTVGYMLRLQIMGPLGTAVAVKGACRREGSVSLRLYSLVIRSDVSRNHVELCVRHMCVYIYNKEKTWRTVNAYETLIIAITSKEDNAWVIGAGPQWTWVSLTSRSRESWWRWSLFYS